MPDGLRATLGLGFNRLIRAGPGRSIAPSDSGGMILIDIQLCTPLSDLFFKAYWLLNEVNAN